jgi:hypothetical protein
LVESVKRSKLSCSLRAVVIFAPIVFLLIFQEITSWQASSRVTLIPLDTERVVCIEWGTPKLPLNRIDYFVISIQDSDSISLLVRSTSPLILDPAVLEFRGQVNISDEDAYTLASTHLSPAYIQQLKTLGFEKVDFDYRELLFAIRKGELPILEKYQSPSESTGEDGP